MKKKKYLSLMVFSLLLFTPSIGHGMHIMEGFLPSKWAVLGHIVFTFFNCWIKKGKQSFKGRY